MPLYMAFVPYNGHYKTIQLEKSLMVDWVLGCSTAPGDHRNYGEAATPEDAAAFYELIKSRSLIDKMGTPEASFQAGDNGVEVTVE